MKRHPVESRAIASIGHDEARQTLEVEFRSGRIYEYAGVGRELFEWLLRVPNKGAVFNRLVKDRFVETDVTPEAPALDLVALLESSVKAPEGG